MNIKFMINMLHCVIHQSGSRTTQDNINMTLSSLRPVCIMYNWSYKRNDLPPLLYKFVKIMYLAVMK